MRDDRGIDPEQTNMILDPLGACVPGMPPRRLELGWRGAARLLDQLEARHQFAAGSGAPRW